MLREGIPEMYKEPLILGTAKLCVNETLISEQVCDFVNGTPTVTWETSGCAELYGNNWAQFLCAPSSNHIALYCPTWDTIKNRTCSVSTKCCKRPTGIIDGVEYFLEPLFVKGVRYMTYIDKENGTTLKTHAGNLRIEAANGFPSTTREKLHISR